MEFDNNPYDIEILEETLLTLIETLEDVIATPYVLQQARNDLDTLQESEQSSWRLEISRDNPLRFAKSLNSRGAKLIPELNCVIEGSTEDKTPFSRLNIEIKLKSDDPTLIFRSEWDSECIKSRIDASEIKERVMLRFHFDNGKHTEDGEPAFHFNVGGVSTVDELCWMPTTIRNPRIPYMPIDLVLACELIVSNFFPKKYVELQGIPEWRAVVYSSEYILLRPFLQTCAIRSNTAIERRREVDDDTIMWSMWMRNNIS